MARILLIDDDRDYRAVLREFIEARGHTVLEAESAREGTDIFLKEKVDLVVSDFMMPEKSGMELLTELKRIHPKVLFIMVTGFATLETTKEAIRLGAYDILPKPVEMDQLAVVMHRALSTIELQSHLSTVRGVNYALLLAIPLWLGVGYLLFRFIGR
ncbi:MAG: response regulator [Calditrichaeota bacterium]|nr:response regulator [Calditrichota bacterium]MCB9366541.1 response regulator [Calditrichota bacterium]MCB9391201.1 response regulator [Calditrichota bacterium]